MTLILRAEDLSGLITPRDAVEAIEQAYRSLPDARGFGLVKTLVGHGY